MTEPAAAGGSPLCGLFDHLADGVLVYDLEGRLVDHSARARALLGLAGDEVARLSLAAEPDGAHPIPPLAALWPEVVRGEAKTPEFRARGPKGAVDLQARVRRVELAGSPAVLVELRDVTIYKQRERALVDSKKQLEGAVLVRTRDLQAKMALIERQQRALLELSTPVIQVWEGVLVLPLIGEVDDTRAAQVTESVLGALARTRSSRVIVDLTGVPELGEAASAALLRTIQAVRLLGAECSLSGLSARLAQVLAQREVEWTHSVRMFGDLQAALKAAVAGG